MRSVLALLAVLPLGCDPDPIPVTDGGTPINLGQAFVERRGCATCHEEPGAGTLAGQSMPRPGTQAFGLNLTPDLETGIGGWPDIQIVRAMRFGINDEGHSLCTIMPRHTDMTDLEAYAIVDYLRTLQAVRRKIPESTCPR